MYDQVENMKTGYISPTNAFVECKRSKGKPAGIIERSGGQERGKILKTSVVDDIGDVIENEWAVKRI
jgi:hypothetical protein